MRVRESGAGADSAVVARGGAGERTQRAGLRVVLGSPATVESALLETIAGLRASDALAPIDVLVGGILQRPYLQRRIAATSPGLLNVRFSTLGELGLRLGEPKLAASGRRPLPAIAERAYVAEVGRAIDGYFAPVAATPGFADAARRLLRELRQERVSPPELRQLAAEAAESPAKGEALAALYERYLDGRGGAFDGEDALAEADPARFDGTALLLFGVWRLTANGRRLVEAIARRVAVTLFLPSVGADADEAHGDLRRWAEGLGATVERLPSPAPTTPLLHVQRHLFATAEPLEPDDSVGLVSAPDPLTEVREVARICLAWAREGIAFREMAVTYRQAEVYRPLVEAVFAEAGLPVYLDDGPSLAERPLGRRILALLDLVDSKLPRRDVMAFLSDGWLPKATRERFGGAPAARWDSVSRRAGVVEGIDQWQQRLRLLRESDAERAADDEAPEWARRRIEDCDSLLAFVEHLAADLAAHPPRASWAGSLDFLAGLLETYVQEPRDVIGYLDALRDLDRLVPEVEFDRFLDVVRAEIRALKAGDLDEAQQGAFARRGVNVLDVNGLRHLRFRAVAVLGLTERSFPPPPRQDPLLLDHERRRLNLDGGFSLPLRALGPDPEPLQFALAVHAADERLLLSTRRADEAGGRTQIPSSFFRMAAATLAGRRVTVEEAAELPFVRRVPAGRIGGGETERALTLVERDRTLLETEPAVGRAVLERLEPRAVRADELRRARWGRRELTPFDGTFASPGAIALAERGLAEGKPLSATGLETYASCPFKYFLGNVLRIKPLEEPERLLQIHALTKGGIVHEILRLFYAGHADRRLEAAAAEELRATLREIAERALGEAEAQGLTGTALLWARDRQDILDDLAGWLEHEFVDPAPHTRRGLEVAFGGRWHGEEDPLDRDDVFELQVGERTLRLHGQIDRLDHGESGFRVIDYKTGRLRGKPGSLEKGRKLQLPLYLQVGAWLLDTDARQGEAAYHGVSRLGGFGKVVFTGEHLEQRSAELDQVLGRIADGIASGDFHPEPGDDICRWCDFDPICDVARKRIIDRKGGDPRVASFRALAEIE
jgi:ATP-dependent helicase/nuclease subunit B